MLGQQIAVGGQQNDGDGAFYLDLRQGLPLREVEKILILSTLREQQFNKTHTARVLGIGLRTLQRRLKEYDQDLVLPS